MQPLFSKFIANRTTAVRIERSRRPVLQTPVFLRSRPSSTDLRKRQSHQSMRRSVSTWSRLDNSNLCNFSMIIDLINKQSFTNRPHRSLTRFTCGSFIVSSKSKNFTVFCQVKNLDEKAICSGSKRTRV